MLYNAKKGGKIASARGGKRKYPKATRTTNQYITTMTPPATTPALNNYWLTATDTAYDNSWVALMLETRTEDGEIITLSEEVWERNEDGSWQLTDIEFGDPCNTLAYITPPFMWELIELAMQQEDEPYFFAA